MANRINELKKKAIDLIDEKTILKKQFDGLSLDRGLIEELSKGVSDESALFELESHQKTLENESFRIDADSEKNKEVRIEEIDEVDDYLGALESNLDKIEKIKLASDISVTQVDTGNLNRRMEELNDIKNLLDDEGISSRENKNISLDGTVHQVLNIEGLVDENENIVERDSQNIQLRLATDKDEEKTPVQLLSDYMNMHNYSKEDASIYMKDPEWRKLHGAAFPNYKMDLTTLVSEGTVSGKFVEIIQYSDCKEKPQVVDRDIFESCVRQSGVVCFRTFSDGNDGTPAGVYKNRLISDSADEFQHNGTGYMAFGEGIYLTANSDSHEGESPNVINIESARDCSLMYGQEGHRATACVTLAEEFNIADGEEIKREFRKLPIQEQLKYMSNDYRNTQQGLASYAVAKGYDGLKWKNAGVACDYLTVYNRHKLIVLRDPNNVAYGIK